MKPSPTHYTRVAIWLHWISALLILGLIPGGLFMTSLADGDPLKTSIYKFHATMGTVVFLLTAFRLLWLLRHRWPAVPPKIEGAHKWLFKGVHVLLYGIVLLLTTSGLGMLFGSGIFSPFTLTPEAILDIPPRTMHMLSSRLLMGLFLVHFAGVVLYQLQKGDVLSRMGAPWFQGLTRK